MSGGTSRGTEGARGGGGRAVSANVWVEGTSKYTNERMKSSGANARARARARVCVQVDFSNLCADTAPHIVVRLNLVCVVPWGSCTGGHTCVERLDRRRRPHCMRGPSKFPQSTDSSPGTCAASSTGIRWIASPRRWVPCRYTRTGGRPFDGCANPRTVCGCRRGRPRPAESTGSCPGSGGAWTWGSR